MHMNILRKWRKYQKVVWPGEQRVQSSRARVEVLAGCWHNRAHDDELPLTLDNKQERSYERDNDLAHSPPAPRAIKLMKASMGKGEGEGDDEDEGEAGTELPTF